MILVDSNISDAEASYHNVINKTNVMVLVDAFSQSYVTYQYVLEL